MVPLANGVESPCDQPHRKDPQVVEDREAVLTNLTPQAVYDVLNWPCTQVLARARNPPTRGAREAMELQANGVRVWGQTLA